MNTRSDKRVKELLDAMPEALVVTDAEGTIVFTNANIKAVFGYKPEEILGSAAEILIPERLRTGNAGTVPELFSSAQTNDADYELEAQCLHKSGEEFPAEITLAQMDNESGLRIAVSIRNISRRKRIEKELVRAREASERANRAKSSFLTTASHDLRQPAQTLSMLISALDRLADTTPLKEVARRQRQALDTMADLLNSLLDISKLESGSLKPVPADFELKLMFERMRNSFALPALKKGIELVVDETSAIVHTDRHLLERIIENLVGNAIRYTEKGKVWLRGIEHPDYIRIEVIDTGIGIPVDALQTIFTEFHQIRNTHERATGEGLGLGLAIVDRMVDLLDIPLEVESTPGEGSTFAVEIPVGTNAADITTSPSAIDSRSLAGMQALVVDDDFGVRNSMRILLEIEGCKVTEATSIAGAVEGTIAAPPDIIIADYHLPGAETGMDVIQRVREQTAQRVPALLVSGNTSPAVQENLLENCLLLSKPVNTDHFIGSIQELVKPSSAPGDAPSPNQKHR